MAVRHTLKKNCGLDTSRLSALCELWRTAPGDRSTRASRSPEPTHSATNPAYTRPRSSRTPPLTSRFPRRKRGESGALRDRQALRFGGVQSLLAARGISVPASLCKEILAAVRRCARERKEAVTPQELAAIAREMLNERARASMRICA